MIDDEDVLATMRTRLGTLSVLDPTAGTLSATATGYARASGSFLTDGLRPGMEITPEGFASNPVAVLQEVQALTVTVDEARTAEAAAGSRKLTVVLPATQSWENMPLDPEAGKPYVEEDFLGGPQEQFESGPEGRVIYEPLYVLRLNVPEGVGSEASNRYLRALFALFRPMTAIAMTNGDTIRVRENPAPFRGQLLRIRPGWATVTFTIPLRIYTAYA